MTVPTGTRSTGSGVEDAVALGEELVAAWGSWSPTMTPDARRVAFISDRSGVPQLYVQTRAALVAAMVRFLTEHL